MNLEILKAEWEKEEKYSFEGWDFSHLTGRMEEEGLPWDYKATVESYMDKTKIMMDMGTGGGEFLLSLKPSPGKTFATEGYPPNFELSKRALAPFGIEVREIKRDAKLPFEDNFFDLVINRHESYCLSEVKRVMKRGGIFITQQVGGRNNKDMAEFLLGNFSKEIDETFNLEKLLNEAEAEGLRIIKQREYFPKAYFYDVGALVYFAKIIQWEFPGFSVQRCFPKLIELQRQIEEQKKITSIEHRFFAVATKE